MKSQLSGDDDGITGFQIFGMVSGGLVILAVLILIFGSWVTVPAGNRGVLLHMGAVTGVILPEGMSGKMPFTDSVVVMNVQVQKEQVQAEAASKDLQTVHATVAVNLRVMPDKVASLYQGVGTDYMDRVVAPAIQESIKSVIAHYTAEELITKREAVKEEAQELLKNKMLVYGLSVEATNIVNFDFSPSFNASIEAKVTAEQNALAARNKLEQMKYEAEQAVAVAKGKAEAFSIESKALQNNPQVLQLRALEKWNGVLPTVMSADGAVPFIQVKGS